MSLNSIILIVCLVALTVGAFKTSLYKRDNYRQQVIREKNWPEFRKINRATINRHRNISIAQFGSSSQPLYDFADQMYFVRISAGTPPQVFEVLFETSTGNTWFEDRSCNGSYQECPLFCQVSYDFCKTNCEDYCCNSTTSSSSFDDLDPCVNKNQFDQTASSTYQKDGRTFSLPYGVGTVSGFLGIDTITLGDSKNGSQVAIKNTTFGQAQRLAVEYAKVPFDGVLGLGYQSSSIDNVQPVFQHGVDLGLFDEPIFTVRLVNEGSSSRDVKGGDLVFGSRDPDNCANDANFLPLVIKDVWGFQTDALGVNGAKTQKKQIALLSYGTPMILLSYSDLLDVVLATSADYNFNFGLYQVACDLKFTWSVFVGDNEFKVDQDNLVTKIDDNTCLLVASDWGNAAHFIDLVLGVPFMRQFCTMFDIQNQQIGFATKLNNS